MWKKAWKLINQCISNGYESEETDIILKERKS